METLSFEAVDERAGGQGRTRMYALMPKSIDNSFFFPSRDGCYARASSVGAECIYVGPEYEEPTGTLQAAAIHALIDAHLNGTRNLDGLAVSVVNAEAVAEPFRRATEDAGIPVITFDSDAPNSVRSAYVGTNNRAFGNQLGEGLLQLRPQGGFYSIVANSAPNLMERVEGVRETLKGTTWTELTDAFIDDCIDPKLCLAEMVDLAEELGSGVGIHSMIPCLAGPMDSPPAWEAFAIANRNMTFVVGDAMPHQIALFEKGYANALVGQLPYQAGELCVDTLAGLANQKQASGENRMLRSASQQEDASDMVFGTNLNLLLRVPLVLPPVEVDYNYIGQLAVLGYVLAAIVICLSAFFTLWTFWKRDKRVVRASQPIFLFMILIGVAIMGSSIIPMGIEGSDVACNLVPWLLSLGFVTTFSALLSKTLRVNRIMKSAARCSRVKVTARDVMAPFFVLLGANVIVLACWTAISPLKYTRAAHVGRDVWGREISTYGYCASSDEHRGGSVPYYACLIIINLGAVIISNIQAYQARNVAIEYAESHWIAIIIASMLQAGVIGIPLLFLVGTVPQASFVVKAFIVFATCMSCLLFLFVPKYLHEQKKHPRSNAIGVNTDSKLKTQGSTNVSSSGNAEAGGVEEDNGSKGLRAKFRRSTFLSLRRRSSGETSSFGEN